MIRASRFVAAIVTPALLAACGGDRGGNQDTTAGGAASASSGVDLNGAGATFPYPIYRKWFADYAANTGVKINYQSIGSGGGVRQLTEGTVDFGGSDSPMSDEEIARAKGPVMHIPTVLGAVVLTYNVPGIQQPLRLSGTTIADIFLGRITKWNDPRIATLNRGVTLPGSDILVVYRSDGSGTTYVFTDYLATISPAWSSGPGRSKEVKWPVGIGARGNEGVAGQVKQTPGSIGYVELAYAKQNALAYAHVQNAAGQFVEPNVQSIAAAAAGSAERITPTSDYRVSVVNAPGAASYPISSYTWILAYYNQTDAQKAQKLRDFLKWALTEGEKTAMELDYAPIPEALSQRLLTRVDSIKVGS